MIAPNTNPTTQRTVPERGFSELGVITESERIPKPTPNPQRLDRLANCPKKYLSRYEKAWGKELSPLEAIRLQCLECCGHERKEVDLCTATACPLYAYRKGAES